MIRETARSIGIALLLYSAPAWAIKIGQSPDNFELKGHDGKIYRLNDYKDKFVVLEWFNDDCPYVKKHYGAKNMQGLQQKYTDKNVVWFTIVSSAPGKQGYLTEASAKELIKKHDAKQTAILFDPEGKVGSHFEAKTTPHMYILDKGKLVYMGAIDDTPSAKPSSLKDAKPLFANALDAALGGKKITNPSTTPYGCSVKYK